MDMRASIRSAAFAGLVLAGPVSGPDPVLAQDLAGITGTVADGTGAALPGAAVEARSPALIERARTVFTDGAGNYRFVALPPGVYAVTFTLQGFRTTVREGIVLAGAFVAPVDAVMEVGGVEETVTVRGAAPLVDVVSTQQQTVLTADEINTLPGASSLMTGMQYVPGVQGNQFSQSQSGVTVRGSDRADSQSYVDGIESGMQLGGRNVYVGGIGLVTDEAQIAEIVYDTSSQGAEYAQSGLRSNMIPKAGGNDFSGDVFLDAGHQRFISDNHTQELKDQGFSFAPQAWNWSLNPALGGPVARDRVWFFGSYVKNLSKNYLLDSFFDPGEPSTPAGIRERCATPDSCSQEELRTFNQSDSSVQNGRVTWQVSRNNKLTSGFTAHQNNFERVVGTGFGRVAPEALFGGDANPTYLSTTRWTWAASSRMLVETTVSYQRSDLAFKDFDENGEARIPFQDLATGLRSGTSHLQNFRSEDHRRNVQASVSYVTGSHNFKAGVSAQNNLQYGQWKNNADIFTAQTVFGNPLAVLVMGNGDVEDERKMNCDCGLYAQDSWTLDRLTLNLGLRYDWFNNSLAGGHREAGWFTPEITADPVEDLPDWNDWNGRFGVAYDLFGDGRTALKGFAGRYVANEALGITTTFSPFGYNIDYRFWTDLNGDGTLINADGTPQLAEIAPSFNPNYGTPSTANRLDPDVERMYNWEYSGGLQHELAAGWSLSGMWHRRSYGNFRWTDNTSVAAGDYTTLTITGPTDARLPGGGGETITVYELADPAFAFSTGDVLHTQAPDDSRTWNGFELIADGRLWRNGFLQASWTAGTTANDFCTDARMENPNGLRFCRNSTGYRHLFKISGSAVLPYDVMISGLFQVFPGRQILADYLVSEGDVGRRLNLGGAFGTPEASGTVELPLIEPGARYEDSTSDLQLRFTKDVRMGGTRLRVFMNASNIFNTLTVTSRNRFFGGGQTLSDDFFRPITVSAGRALTWGMQTTF